MKGILSEIERNNLIRAQKAIEKNNDLFYSIAWKKENEEQRNQILPQKLIVTYLTN